MYVGCVIHTEQQKALLEWWKTSCRDLPWRKTRDPWAVMISELMLQQTQVSRVIPKYESFLKKYPTPMKCSQVPVARLIEEWAGLGYNRRAINLHRTSKIIVESHNGKVPRSLNDLLSLPGIGPYTARAILCFAFEEDIGVVDVNVSRVLARVSGELVPPRGMQEKADDLVPQGKGWTWSQALMDLGSVVCTSRIANCHHCPLEQFCQWRGEGNDPAKPKTVSDAPNDKFKGSDRQGRGRLVEILRDRIVVASELGEVMGWKDDPERCQRVLMGLIKDGLVECNAKKEYSLPR